MGWHMKQERNHCPPHFQDRLTQVGGVNRYGKPNFRIVWSQTYTERRATAEGHYEDYLPNFSEPCWVLQQWFEEALPASVWYWQLYDEGTGCSLAGEYPYQGQYRTQFMFRTKELVNGKLVVEMMPLNSMLLTLAIPIILATRNVTFLERQQLMREREAKEEKDRTTRIGDRLQDARPMFTGPVSYRGQGNRSSAVQQRMDSISRSWDRTMKTAKSFTRGISQRSV